MCCAVQHAAIDCRYPRWPEGTVCPRRAEPIRHGQSLCGGRRGRDAPDEHGRYGVALGTVKRASAELQDQGLIVTRQGQGSFVCAIEAVEPTPAPEITQLRERLDQLEARVHAIEGGGAKSPKP
jgi:hypothetical protein